WVARRGSGRLPNRPLRREYLPGVAADPQAFGPLSAVRRQDHPHTTTLVHRSVSTGATHPTAWTGAQAVDQRKRERRNGLPPWRDRRSASGSRPTTTRP